MIESTNGRVVWYWPSADDRRHMAAHGPQPMAAHVAFVFGARCVNLMVIDHSGRQHSRTSVPLLQDGDPRPEGGYFAEWMPYQKGQAQKTEATAADLGAAVRRAGLAGP
jgi:hypothetical protein